MTAAEVRPRPAPETLILTRRDVQALLGYDECIEAVEAAFRLHAEGRSLAPGVLGVPSRAGGFHIKAAGLEMNGSTLRPRPTPTSRATLGGMVYPPSRASSFSATARTAVRWR